MPLILDIAVTHIAGRGRQTIVAVLGVAVGVGFSIAMAALMLLFGQRRWLGLVLYPIAVTVFIYVLFGMLLRVPL